MKAVNHKLVRILSTACAAIVVVGAACATSKENTGPVVREPPREPWRATRPAAAPAEPLKFPPTQKAELKNGMTLILVEDHSLPLVHAALVVRAGSALDAKEAGVASLTWDLLDEGAGSLNAAGLATAFADIGTSLGSSSDVEMGSLRVDVLKEHADRALELVALVVQKPSFAQADFDRKRKEHQDALTANRGDPATVAREVLRAEVYGADHPYGHASEGTQASVDKLRQSAVKRFWSDHASPKAAGLVLVGDLTLDEAKALAEKHFGKWKGAGKAPKPPPPPKVRTATKIVVVNFPDAPQTQVRVARALTAVNDPDEAALIVVNQVVGGMFNSRLNLKLREEKGWTYGVGSIIEPRVGLGPFVVATDVEASVTGDAVVEILGTLDALKTGGVTEAELALAKANYANAIPGLFAIPPAVVDFNAGLFGLGLGTDHSEKLVAAVAGVTAEQAKKAAERAVVKEDFVVVLVGDRAKIEAGLKDKNLGEIVFVNPDGTPAK